MQHYLFNKTKLYQQIRNNEPALDDFVCYIFTKQEARQLYEAMKENTHVINCDIRTCELAEDFTIIERYKYLILKIIQGNAERELTKERAIHEMLLHRTGGV
jgi:hypothetical protein